MLSFPFHIVWNRKRRGDPDDRHDDHHLDQRESALAVFPPEHVIRPILSWYTHSASHLHAKDIPFKNRRTATHKPLKFNGSGRTIPLHMNILWTYGRQFSSKVESLKNLTLW